MVTSLPVLLVVNIVLSTTMSVILIPVPLSLPPVTSLDHCKFPLEASLGFDLLVVTRYSLHSVLHAVYELAARTLTGTFGSTLLLIAACIGFTSLLTASSTQLWPAFCLQQQQTLIFFWPIMLLLLSSRSCTFFEDSSTVMDATYVQPFSGVFAYSFFLSLLLLLLCEPSEQRIDN